VLSANNLDRIMGHLGYPVTRYYSGMVYDGAVQLERYGGTIAENRVIGYLDDLDADLAKLKAGAGGANLIQADVLKWAQTPGGRLAGVYQDYARLQAQLAKTLELKIYSSVETSGGNTLTRG
jgi:hypothetical protein